MFHLYSMNH